MNEDTFCTFGHLTLLLLTFFTLSVAQCNKTTMGKKCFIPIIIHGYIKLKCVNGNDYVLLKYERAMLRPPCIDI